MITILELQQFCSTNPNWPYLHKPWSRGEFTYATNGYIIIRLPRLADVPENEKAPDPEEKVFPSIIDQIATKQIPEFNMPEIENDECGWCEGRGTKHACRRCDCNCEQCNGTGNTLQKVSIELFGHIFNAHYIKMIAILPNARLAIGANYMMLTKFEFDGGMGAIMPCTDHYALRVELP